MARYALMTNRISDNNTNWDDDKKRIVWRFSEAETLFNSENRSSTLKDWSSFEVAPPGTSNSTMKVGSDGHII